MCVHISSQDSPLANTATTLQGQYLKSHIQPNQLFNCQNIHLPSFEQNTLQLPHQQQMEDNICIL